MKKSKTSRIIKSEIKNDNTIAIIRGGVNNNQFINITNEDNEPKLNITNLFDHIDEKTVRKAKKYMTYREMNDIKEAFEKPQYEPRTHIIDTYNKIKPIIETSIMKHIKINDGILDYIGTQKDDMVNRILICGQSGSGKSTWIKGFILNFLMLRPDYSVYMISKLTHDESIDPYIENLKRIKIDSDILEFDLDENLTDFTKSIVIFDDIDTISDMKIYKKIKQLQASLIEVGRHNNIHTLSVSHQLMNGTHTKALILESTAVVIFLGSAKYQQQRYYKQYEGFSKELIKIINESRSRYLIINNLTYPKTLIFEHDIYIV
jgi:hypothetical protein